MKLLTFVLIILFYKKFSDHNLAIKSSIVTSSAEPKPRECDTRTMCKDHRFHRH